jgi:hypothetical protein
MMLNGQQNGIMRKTSTDYGIVFNPETIQLLRTCLEQAWAQLSPIEQATTLKSSLAIRMLRAAGAGERDPVILRRCALLRIVSSPQAERNAA